MENQLVKQSFIDPVCRMKVSSESSIPSYEYQSDVYHFCADGCRMAFMENPEKYLAPKTAKRKGWWERYLDRLNKATGGKPPCCH
jgi:YHS domain-containing protein